MKLRVVDFEVLTMEYKNYQEGIKKIETEKNEFIKSLDPVKKEMEDIINQMNGDLDPKTQIQKEERFRLLQEQAIDIDNSFKREMKRMHDELNKKTFAELSEIIDKYSIENDLDVVMGKMEIVFLKPEFEITSDIVEVLGQMGLRKS